MSRVLEGPVASPAAPSPGFPDGTAPSGPQVRAYLQDALGALQDVEQALVATGPGKAEALHRHRIALRRIRAIAGQFKSVLHPAGHERLRALLAGWGKCSNRARDLEVMLEARQRHATLVPAGLLAALDAIYGALAAERDRELRTVIDRFAGAAHQAEREEAAGILVSADPGGDHATSMERLARSCSWRAYRRICSQAAAGLSAQQPGLVHALRIRCKKLRYLLDICGHLAAPGAHVGLARELRTVQAALGSFNDTSVQMTELRKRVHHHRRDNGARLAVEALHAAMERESATRFALVAGAVAGLTAPATRARYRQLLRRP